MDRNKIENRLLSWDQNELFYRDYACRKLEGKSVEDLLQRKVPAEWIQWAADPAGIDPDKTENDFFRAGNNISIVKHPRYFPYFEHKHTFFEMIYVLSGRCRETTQGETVLLKQGDLFLLAPNITHGIEAMDDSVVINILIRHSTFMDIFLNTVREKSEISLFFLGNLYDRDKIPYLLYHTGSDEQIRGYILDMAAEQLQEDGYADKITCALLTVFFHQLTRRYAGSVETPAAVQSGTQEHNEMLQYIMMHYQTITLSGLAEAFHFSTPYCSKLIRKISGDNFSRLITKIRLQQGENLLSHTQLNVGDISSQVGYKNPETFIRAFLRDYKMTPSQYRKSKLVG